MHPLRTICVLSIYIISIHMHITCVCFTIKNNLFKWLFIASPICCTNSDLLINEKKETLPSCGNYREMQAWSSPQILQKIPKWWLMMVSHSTSVLLIIKPKNNKNNYSSCLYFPKAKLRQVASIVVSKVAFTVLG